MNWKEIIRNIYLQHLAFWGASFLVLLRLFAYEEQLYAADYIYTLLFHISLTVAVYLNLRLLIPYLLEKRRYIAYLLAFIFLFWISILLNELTFDHLSDWLFPDYFFISYYTYFEIGQFIGSYLVISMLFKFSKAWFELSEKEKKITQLESEKTAAELEGLKAQIQPHFLFNNLNSIYALAIDQDERTPEVILALSDNLRYILYDCIHPKVLLEKEIEFIERFLELQELRLASANAIKWQLTGQAEHKKVAPLLFLPFLENAFKHGQFTTEQAFEIALNITEKEVHFSIKNKIRPKDENIPEKKGGGIGLSNVKKRLDILYPDEYQLDIKETTANVFTVHLNIPI